MRCARTDALLQAVCQRRRVNLLQEGIDGGFKLWWKAGAGQFEVENCGEIRNEALNMSTFCCVLPARQYDSVQLKLRVGKRDREDAARQLRLMLAVRACTKACHIANFSGNAMGQKLGFAPPTSNI
jgi:hypothetical protein